MTLKQGICTLLLTLGSIAAPAADTTPTPETGDIATHYPRFVPRPDVRTEQRGNLQLTSVLADGGAPYPGTMFTIMREEPAAYGKTRRTVLASSGPHAQSNFDLSPGRYLVRARNGAVEVEQPVEVPRRGVLRQLVVLNAGELHLSSSMDAAGEPAEGTWFRVLRPHLDSYGRSTRIQVAGNGYAPAASFLLPAGEYTAEASYGDARTELSIRIDPAGVHSHSMVLKAGRLKLFTTLVADGEPVGGALIRVLRMQTDQPEDNGWTELARAQDTDGITFILPEGDYLAQASLGEAEVRVPVQVTAAETQVIELPLNAGEVNLQTVLQGHSEPLLDAWFRVQAKTGPDEDTIAPRSVRSARGKARFIVPAGRYLTGARVGEGEGTAEIEVQAGESQTHTIALEAGRVSLRLAADEQAPPYPDSWFSVYRAEFDAHGQELRRRMFNVGYYAETAVVLPAGRYIAMARNHRHKGERIFTLSAGEVIQVSIPTRPGTDARTTQTDR